VEISEFKRGIPKLRLAFGERFSHGSDEESRVALYEMFKDIQDIPDAEYLSSIDRIVYFGSGPYQGINFFLLIRENLPSVVEGKPGVHAWKEVLRELDRIKNVEPPFFCDAITQGIVGEWSWRELRQSLTGNTAMDRYRIEFVKRYDRMKKEFSLSFSSPLSVMEDLDKILKKRSSSPEEDLP